MASAVIPPDMQAHYPDPEFVVAKTPEVHKKAQFEQYQRSKSAPYMRLVYSWPRPVCLPDGYLQIRQAVHDATECDQERAGSIEVGFAGLLLSHFRGIPERRVNCWIAVGTVTPPDMLTIVSYAFSSRTSAIRTTASKAYQNKFTGKFLVSSC